jgi:hypothetical protein
MRGSSGASLTFCGDFVLKRCADAANQHDWFRLASTTHLCEGIYLPRTQLQDQASYLVEFIQGTCATAFSSTQIIDKLCDQIDAWRNHSSQSVSTWNNYLDRLEDHARTAQSAIVSSAVEFIKTQEPFPASFGHGDLTLENVIVAPSGKIFLIDPNNKPDVFQSWLLDYGKLLQSIHADYHRVFSSHAGVDPAPLLAHVRSRLGGRLFQQAINAEITHLIRLRKYRSPREAVAVDGLIAQNLPDSWSANGL